jgi:hypothetical protein
VPGCDAFLFVICASITVFFLCSYHRSYLKYYGFDILSSINNT